MTDPAKTPTTSSKKAPAGAVAVAVLLGMLAAVLSPNEGGRHLKPCLDSAAIWTACVGIIGPEVTRRGKAGESFTDAECDALETKYLERMHADLSRCIGPELLDQISIGEFLAYGDGAYNFGTGAMCKSPMAAKLKAGDRRGACEAIASYRVHTGTPGNRKPRGKGTWVASMKPGKPGRWLQDCRDPANKCSGLPKRREQERQLCLSGLPEGM